MDPKDLEVDSTYITTGEVKACFYDKDDCLMPDAIDLQIGTDLIYVGPDAEDGYVFEYEDGTKLCLHDNDLVMIEES